MKQYKFLSLKELNSKCDNELKQAACRVIDSGWFIMGNELKEFEKNLSEYCNTTHAIGTSNGLDALRLIFRAYIELNIMNPGDEIIVSANTYVASILAISDSGLKPVLVEPSLLTMNLDSSLVENSITSRTKGSMIVNLYSSLCWVDKLK